MCHQSSRPSLGGEAGGRSLGFISLGSVFFVATDGYATDYTCSERDALQKLIVWQCVGGWTSPNQRLHLAEIEVAFMLRTLLPAAVLVASANLTLAQDIDQDWQ